VGFEPTISAGERPKTYALDRAATGTGDYKVTVKISVLNLKLPTTTIVAQPFNVIKWQLKFNPVA